MVDMKTDEVTRIVNASLRDLRASIREYLIQRRRALLVELKDIETRIETLTDPPGPP